MPLSEDPAAAVARALAFASDEEPTLAWKVLDDLAQRAAGGDLHCARELSKATRAPRLDRTRRLGLVADLLDAYGADLEVLFQLGFATETLVERAYVNAPPPREATFHSIVRALAIALDGPLSDDGKHALSASLAVSAMVAGQKYDALAEHAHRELMRLQKPLGWATLYDLGLFLKTRGRYAEATEILLYAVELGGADRPLFWNLAVCATGARNGDLALEIWRDRLGIAGLRMGQFGLPEFREATVQVRLAEFPMSGRDETADHPGREEIIWVERLSPAHGIVRNALEQDIGTDFGDVVLFDGAPLTTRTFGDRKVPVYAHLCTLESGLAQRFSFRATQSSRGQITAISTGLPGKSMLYIPGDHDLGPATGAAHVLVEGAVCVPREVELRDLVDLLDAVIADADDPELRILCPDLHTANGDADRAEREGQELTGWPPPSRSG